MLSLNNAVFLLLLNTVKAAEKSDILNTIYDFYLSICDASVSFDFDDIIVYMSSAVLTTGTPA